jgi:uncharacterized protein (DUF2147 family)
LRITDKFVAVATACTVLAGLTSAATAGSPYGTWQRPATGVVVKIFPCGGGLGVKVVKSSVPNRIGKVYMCGAKNAGKGVYQGRLRNPEDNGIYNGRARLISARRMELSGCIPHTSLCRSEVWRRLR